MNKSSKLIQVSSPILSISESLGQSEIIKYASISDVMSEVDLDRDTAKSIESYLGPGKLVCYHDIKSADDFESGKYSKDSNGDILDLGTYKGKKAALLNHGGTVSIYMSGR